MKAGRVIRLHEKDNVITSLEFIPRGTAIPLWDLEVEEDIKFGHKIALEHIEKGDKVLKYGVPIGVAFKTIEKGSHVHLHNLKSLQVKGESHERIQESGWKNRNT